MAKARFHARGWRESYARFLDGVQKELTIVAPYMRDDEADFTVRHLRSDVRVDVLTDMNDAALVAGALQAEAVLKFATFSESSGAFNLPRLHAKIYVADKAAAILSSANLTRGGLDNNFEYGVEITGEAVSRIKKDVAVYKGLGTAMTSAQLEKIASLTKAARENKPAVKSGAKQKELLTECLRLRVGERAPTAIFGDVLRYVLADGKAMTHRDIVAAIEGIYPDLCTDEEHVIQITGISYGKKWKHYLRNAQLSLKKQGSIEYIKRDKLWRLKG